MQATRKFITLDGIEVDASNIPNGMNQRIDPRRNQTRFDSWLRSYVRTYDPDVLESVYAYHECTTSYRGSSPIIS